MATIQNRLYSYRSGFFTFEGVYGRIEQDVQGWLNRAEEHKNKYEQIKQEEEEKAKGVELDELASQNIKIVETYNMIADLSFAVNENKHTNENKALNIEDFPNLVAVFDRSAKIWDEFLDKEEDLINSLVQSPCEPQVKLAFVEGDKMINARFSNIVSGCAKDLATAKDTEVTKEDESGL